jgi:hypothetical protein
MLKSVYGCPQIFNALNLMNYETNLQQDTWLIKGQLRQYYVPIQTSCGFPA